ncbi:MAG: prephenate dehydratase [Dehalogenimonas sp.]|uniref:Prephenate dehydratase n=1 Tax=Candidatus Dehalogenimonas loeffleri TaxID=3127115 RepID=A0ABZ2J4R9_9CHLR|nr:prephenate dehydratase [Dehalogenimonas sp.]
MIKISIQGSRGSFHDIVARKKFPGDSEIIESETFKQVFDDVHKGVSDYGVVAIENSIYGSFLDNYDHLLKYDTRIVGEEYLRIVLNLIALPNTKIENITEVYTHPMAMNQAEEWLEKHPKMQRIETDDTAAAVRLIKEDDMHTAAAIGSVLAAEIYGMKVIAKDIETEKKNYTRFLIIARPDAPYDLDADKTSLVIRAKNIPGALYNVLKCFNDEDINLSKIESRPIIGKSAWDYYFYLDFEKGLNAPATQRALKGLEKVASMIKILGTYRRDDKVDAE